MYDVSNLDAVPRVYRNDHAGESTSPRVHDVAPDADHGQVPAITPQR